MNTQEIQISDYNYELPDERIAKFPKEQRDHSKLLLYRHGEVGEDVFYNLPRTIRASFRLVCISVRLTRKERILVL